MNRCLATVSFLIFFAISANYCEAGSSLNYKCEWEVISTRGGIAQSAGFKALFTIDQAAIGFGTSSSYKAGGGFWYGTKYTGGMVGVFESHENTTLPEFKLRQNYPNPFNPITTIEFSVPQPSQVTVRVFNILGQEVRKLIDEPMSTGTHEVEWDGTDASGQTASTGIYFYRVRIGEHLKTKKMVMVK